MAKKKVPQYPFAGILPKPAAKPKPKRQKSGRNADPYTRWLATMVDWRADRLSSTGRAVPFGFIRSLLLAIMSRRVMCHADRLSPVKAER
jgi:hypothetical protein